MAQIGCDIVKAKDLLSRRELVGIPTETVYGLAANALDPAAVIKIFEVKNRPQFDPLIVHVADAESALHYIVKMPEKAKILIDHFWPGPLTIVLPKKDIIPDIVSSGLDTIGIRCPDHPLTRSLLKQIAFPLAAPSANPFGYVSPTTAQHVDDQLGDKVSYILDGGPCQVGIESTIIGFEDNKPIIYRMGGLGIETLESIIGSVTIQTFSSSNPKAPGQLKSHYAPRVKVKLGNIEEMIKQYAPDEVGILSFQKDYHHPHQIVLSREGDVIIAAQRLFTSLRTLDKLPIKCILAEPAPDFGLGKAINDRLLRATAD